MRTRDYIEQIKKKFSEGANFIELPSADPFHFRKRLYDATRRIGILWGFAITENSVFVIK